MPAYLPQYSRRDFIKRASVAAAGLALAPQLTAADAVGARDVHTFALLSDTHIDADPAKISIKVNMADNLSAVGREIAALPKKPSGALINGDLALDAGLPGDYATLGNLLKPIRAVTPVYLTLGNHDERANFWAAFPDEAAAQRPVKEKHTSVIRSPRANWLVLDSLEITDAVPGDVGAAQLAWLEKELSANADKPAIIVVHHNLNSPDTFAGLNDSEALVKLFARHRRIKAFVFGHTHNWSVTQHDTGVHLINLPPVAYVFKEGRPNGWVRATLAPDGIELELRSLNTSHPEHGKTQELKWREG
ncbi:MAG TPA: metallophosphoesterase [Verrucomicrobiota bacterium]|nr:metallophosphoesterase [Verrucomicrobiota bacterium]